MTLAESNRAERRGDGLVERLIGRAAALFGLRENEAGHDERGKFAGRRVKKPKILAVVTDACTGCAGAPVCQLYCPVDDCMVLVTAADAYPYQRIEVDPLKCVGCRKCLRRGAEGMFLDGCPWDAIVMVPTPDWEAQHGALAY